MANWRFYSTFEQRLAFRNEWPEGELTEEEALQLAERANYLWRGTGTIHTVEREGDGFIVAQELIQ